MATREQCEEWFQKADKDQDGYLTYEEMADMMRCYGYKGPDEQIKVSYLCNLMGVFHWNRPYNYGFTTLGLVAKVGDRGHKSIKKV